VILLVHGDREYLREPGTELQTDLGVLEIPEDAEPGDVLTTHLGEEFRVRRLRGPDLFHHFERTGAPMLPRDVGLVVGETGVGAGDRVLDAGTGTGVLAGYLGRLGVEVLTYERDPGFADVARENMRLAGVDDRVEVRAGDVREAVESLPSGEFDALTLDTEDAPAVVERADALLADGGFLAV
jgi:tRNA (adenine57-N1/adenine58-N1)-methyltransferase